MITTRSLDGIFAQLGFAPGQITRIHRAGRIYGDATRTQLAAIAAASLRHVLSETADLALETCNRELGIRCQDVRSNDES